MPFMISCFRGVRIVVLLFCFICGKAKVIKKTKQKFKYSKEFYLNKIRDSVPEVVLKNLNEAWENFHLGKTPYRVSHIIGQAAYESDNFKYTEELVNFATTKERVLKLFASRIDIVVESINSEKYKIEDFVGPGHDDKLKIPVCADDILDFIFLEEDLDRRKERLLNIVYGMRPDDLGNVSYGDGWKFRGRGYMQITGRKNYREISKVLNKIYPNLNLDFESDPDLIATHYPFLTAIAFFHKENLFALCDHGVDDVIIEKVSKAINTKAHGLDSRLLMTKKVFSSLEIPIAQKKDTTIKSSKKISKLKRRVKKKTRR